MKYTYSIRQDTIQTEEKGPLVVYGIDLSVKNAGKITSIPDIFLVREEAESFVALCNRKQLNPTHLQEVIEDILS